MHFIFHRDYSGKGSAYNSRRYNVKLSLISWAHTQNDHCFIMISFSFVVIYAYISINVHGTLWWEYGFQDDAIVVCTMICMDSLCILCIDSSWVGESTVRHCSIGVNFLKNPHNWHPIAHPNCEIWGVFCKYKTDISNARVTVVQYKISCYMGLHYNVTRLYYNVYFPWLI